jgi:hypothetical protein
MATSKQYRQGDLLFIEVKSLPGGLHRLEHRIIAEGETTGHKHEVIDETAILYEDGNGKFLEALVDTEVVHQEHHTIKIPKGFYKIIQQREYAPGAIRYVQD